MMIYKKHSGYSQRKDECVLKNQCVDIADCLQTFGIFY